jgi:hypothetical protein
VRNSLTTADRGRVRRHHPGRFGPTASSSSTAARAYLGRAPERASSCAAGGRATLAALRQESLIRSFRDTPVHALAAGIGARACSRKHWSVRRGSPSRAHCDGQRHGPGMGRAGIRRPGGDAIRLGANVSSIITWARRAAIHPARASKQAGGQQVLTVNADAPRTRTYKYNIVGTHRRVGRLVRHH